MWSPISSTLIYGRRDAVLVDALITNEQADALVDWVEADPQEPDNHLRYARPRRPFLRRQYSSNEAGPQTRRDVLSEWEGCVKWTPEAPPR